MSWLTNLFKKGPKDARFAASMNGFAPIFGSYGDSIYANDAVQQCIKCIVDELKKLNPLHVRQKGNDPAPVKGNIQDILKMQLSFLRRQTVDDIGKNDLTGLDVS